MYKMLVDFTPVLTSVLAVVVSVYALLRTGKQFEQSSRPYVAAENFSNMDSGRPEPAVFLVLCFSAPAQIVNTHYRFWVQKSDGSQFPILEHRGDKNVVYPGANFQSTFTCAEVPTAIRNLKDGDKLFRETHIFYRSFSTTKDYTHERKSCFEFGANNWRHEWVVAT